MTQPTIEPWREEVGWRRCPARVPLSPGECHDASNNNREHDAPDDVDPELNAEQLKDEVQDDEDDDEHDELAQRAP